MPYRICKTFDIESGHVLSRHPDDCRFPHGHSRRVEVVLEADELDENGMVCDLKLLKATALEALEPFDHALCLNTTDPNYGALKRMYGERVIDFIETEPTSEAMAKRMFEGIQAGLARIAAGPRQRYPLAPSVRVARVRVTETSSSWAEYTP